MNRHRTVLAVALTLFVTLLACGSDDNGPTPPPPPPPDRPDLVVASIVFSPETPGPLEEVTATVTVQNLGTAPAGTSTVRVEVDGSVTCGAAAVGVLDAGQVQEIACTLGFQPTGPHQVRACADAGSAVDEGGEQNNCAADTLTVGAPPPPGPDLFVEAVEFTPLHPAPNEPAQVRITVRNLGNQASAASSVRVELDGVVRCAAVATPSIQAGETAAVSCDLLGNPCGKWPVRACADAAGVITELNEQNNCIVDTLRVGDEPCPPTFEPPVIPATPIRTEVAFGSADSTAVEAKALVEGYLRAAASWGSVTSSALALLADLDWTVPPQDCAVATVTDGPCTSTYRMCVLSPWWEASCERDGMCGGQAVQDFIAWQGRIGMTPGNPVLEGRISFFDPPSTDAVLGVYWQTEPTVETGTWEWYAGAVSTGPLSATFDYSREPDGVEQLTWAFVESTKWTMRVNSAGTDGRMSVQSWNVAGWQDRDEIVWRPDGHGSWTDRLSDPPEVRTW